MFNPNRLKLARRRRKLTGKELAERVGVSYVTISRLENSISEPEPDTLNSLVRALEFPREFFFGKDIDELNKEAASFRSLTSMTSREREAALAAGELAYLLSDWVEERFNLPAPALIDFGHERDPEEAAISLRRHWGLGEKPIGNLLKLLESKGIRVFSLAENTKNVDAFSCWRNGTPYIFLNTFKSAEHSRFDAAHELGHLVLHRHGGTEHVGKSAEIEANAFASAFLMPTADLISHVRCVTSLNQLIREKRRWGVSVAALTYRLHKAGVISDWQYRTIFVQISQSGYRTAEPNGMEFEESVVWKKVLSDLWADRITKSHIAADLSLPVNEVENLIFGLTRGANGTEIRPVAELKKSKLSLV